MLWQYQCGKEGTMFYYQYGGTFRPASHIVERCPVCGSKRVKMTGRKFHDVEEHYDISWSDGISKVVEPKAGE
jgi:hypothetical protein